MCIYIYSYYLKENTIRFFTILSPPLTPPLATSYFLFFFKSNFSLSLFFFFNGAVINFSFVPGMDFKLPPYMEEGSVIKSTNYDVESELSLINPF